MTAEAFADRLARVRQRFVSTLERKINDTDAVICKLSAKAPQAAVSVGDAYRSIHGVVGVGPTVGFPSIGRAARDVESVLRGPYESRRGLSDDEIRLLKKRLHALREAASHELRVFQLI
jgi:chemotaxis protein histidine kinase CheA